MTNKNIIGTFVFRSEGDGCLTSKYYQGNQDYPYVEAAKLYDYSKEHNDPFSGKYKSVWVQNPNHEHLHADLEITWNRNSNTYTLFWRGERETMFEGIGMCYDDLLVGAYWD